MGLRKSQVPETSERSDTVESLTGDFSLVDMNKTYGDEFIKFINENPTVYHATHGFADTLKENGFKQLHEASAWQIEKGGKYFVERNGSSIISFIIGENYKAGNGFIAVGGHSDALTLKVKPNSTVAPNSKFLQVAVAPYAGGGNPTWLDRDLGLAGRVMVKSSGGGYEKKLVRLPGAIGRIPTLAPHFGLNTENFNKETQINPVVGQTAGDTKESAVHPKQLTGAVLRAAGAKEEDLLGWELEFFDAQPAGYLGLDSEFISVGRCDDKLCSWSAITAISKASSEGSLIKVAAAFDNEEVGSLSLQGAGSNFLPATMNRAFESLGCTSKEDCGRAYASSFFVSSDVTHAFDPNWPQAYEEHQRPELNVGPVISYDPNIHMTSDLVSSGLSKLVAEKHGLELQTFQIRNDVRSGGTIGPMLAAKMGVRSVEIGLAQLSMHSIRAMTGAKEPALGVRYFGGFFESFEEVVKEIVI